MLWWLCGSALRGSIVWLRRCICSSSHGDIHRRARGKNQRDRRKIEGGGGIEEDKEAGRGDVDGRERKLSNGGSSSNSSSSNSSNSSSSLLVTSLDLMHKRGPLGYETSGLSRPYYKIISSGAGAGALGRQQKEGIWCSAGGSSKDPFLTREEATDIGTGWDVEAYGEFIVQCVCIIL